ncbi:hypothetical protein K439DRAFT_1308201, partial [Ramaria rubella]
MYLAGLIPGPHEPSKEEVDHYLYPLVQSFISLWDPGVYFNRTAKCPTGRVVRCAIVTFVADLQGSRKTIGAKECPVCGMGIKDVKAGCCLDPCQWNRCSLQEYQDSAECWRIASTLEEQEKIYQTEGVRWSPLSLLEYWDPTKLVVVDAMHALFEGLLQTHIRKRYGVETS